MYKRTMDTTIGLLKFNKLTLHWLWSSGDASKRDVLGGRLEAMVGQYYKCVPRNLTAFKL